MKRRDFLKAAGAAVAAGLVGVPLVGRAQTPERPWWTPPTAHGDRERFWWTPDHSNLELPDPDEVELVVPERLVSWCSSSPYTYTLDVSDYRGEWARDTAGRAVNWLPATGPLAVWQACRWDQLAVGDIVRWRNPEGTYSGQISVITKPAKRLLPAQGHWQVQVDELRNGYRVQGKGWICRFRWLRDGAGEVWLAPEGTPDVHYSKGGSLIALYRVEGERAVMHWELEDKIAEALGVRK